MKFAKIPRDEAVVSQARTIAEQILDADPTLRHARSLAFEVEDLLGDDVEFLFKN